MASEIAEDVWLLIDASGPVSVIGLISGDTWLQMDHTRGDFLEWHQGSVEKLLRDNGLTLPDLSGTIYACGPGSTLGLRLAAMFISSLLRIPSLSHWQCKQYQNLEFAVAAASREGIRQLLAPWHRDKLHLTQMEKGRPAKFVNGSINPRKAAELGLTGIELGRRSRAIEPDFQWGPYPFKQVPGILKEFPELLQTVPEPRPYSAEEPQFAKWSSRRHTAP